MIVLGLEEGMSTGESAAKRGIGDEAVRGATGRSWNEWEALLDARGAAGLPHKEIVALLADGLVESGWWQQTVAVDYERRKGMRAVGQTADVGFNVGAQRRLAITPDEAWRLVTSAKGVRAWLGDARGFAAEKGAEYTTADGASGVVRVARPGSHLRLTWQPPGWVRASTIQVRVMAQGEKTTISLHQEHLPGAAEREEARRRFKAALDALQRLAGET
jgi:uncharacterized protein YndB with AHSA1/START domain